MRLSANTACKASRRHPLHSPAVSPARLEQMTHAFPIRNEKGKGHAGMLGSARLLLRTGSVRGSHDVAQRERRTAFGDHRGGHCCNVRKRLGSARLLPLIQARVKKAHPIEIAGTFLFARRTRIVEEHERKGGVHGQR